MSDHRSDEILAPYGVEMTWDIKAGLMGKRLYAPSSPPRSLTIR